MPITSPNSIKSCYIAEVLKEMGFPVKPAHNRLGEERRVKTPERLKPFIRKAVEELLRERGSYSYKEIQKRALALIMKSQEESAVRKTKGIVAEVKELVREMADDESLFYLD
jgi:hypothetical protein